MCDATNNTPFSSTSFHHATAEQRRQQQQPVPVRTTKSDAHLDNINKNDRREYFQDLCPVSDSTDESSQKPKANETSTADTEPKGLCVHKQAPTHRKIGKNICYDGYASMGLDSHCNRKNICSSKTSKMTVKESQTAFDTALAAIPDEEKVGLKRAQLESPELVRSETDIFRFLLCNDFDAPAAAKQLVQYWNLRLELFGNRAFLPLTQSSGALTDDDVVVLCSGSAALLRNDAKNRNVMITDRSRSLDSVANLLDSKLRCFFYLMSIMSENEVSQRDGYVLICVLLTPRFTECNDDFSNKCVEIMHAVPARLKAVHLLVCPPKTGKKSLVDHVIASTVRTAMTVHGNRVFMHTANGVEDFCKKLENFDLHRDDLPASAGGRWKYEEFIRWQKQRNLLEQQLRNGEAASAINGLDLITKPKLHPSPPPPIDGDSCPLSRKERKRKLNIIHSRQKRERRKNETSKLQDSCAVLRGKIVALKADNDFIEGLIEQASALIVEMNRERAVTLGNSFGVSTYAGALASGGGTGQLLSYSYDHLPITYHQQGMHTGTLPASDSHHFILQKLLSMERMQQDQARRQEALIREIGSINGLQTPDQAQPSRRAVSDHAFGEQTDNVNVRLTFNSANQSTPQNQTHRQPSPFDDNAAVALLLKQLQQEQPNR